MAKTEQPDKMVTKKQSDMNSEIPRKPNPLAAKCCFGIQISPPVVLLLYQVCYQSELLKSMTRDVQTKCLSFVPKSYVTLSVTDSDEGHLWNELFCTAEQIWRTTVNYKILTL